MARPRTHGYWIDKICRLAANQPDLTGAAMRRALKRYAKSVPEGVPESVPSVRTILEIRRRITPEEERAYRDFRWPDSMLAGEVPWEASRAALDFMRHLFDIRKRKPLVREVEWFWRVTLAAPDAPLERRVLFALQLAMRASAATPEIPETPQESVTSIQWQLVYRPWRSPQDLKAWRELPKEWRAELFGEPDEPTEFDDLTEVGDGSS